MAHAVGMTETLRGYTVRPHVPEDIDAVTELIAAVELDVVGEELVTRADMTALWGVDDFDPQRHGVGIFSGDRLVAAGQIYDQRAEVYVHPSATGQGLGSWLRAWTERRAGELGLTAIGQTVPDQNLAAVRILRDAGYQVRHTSWILRIDHPDRPDEPRPPEGVQIRHFRPGDEQAAYQVIETAFNEWPGRTPSTFAQWRATSIDRDDFVAEDFLLAEQRTGHGGEIVGAAFLIDDRDEMWVHQLAVAREHRGRGIARALLQETFRRSFERGYTMSGLSTDSRTGALTLYEKLGMSVRLSFTRYEMPLPARPVT
jgi:GNAT superfamily N-acetyltransferase